MLYIHGRPVVSDAFRQRVRAAALTPPLVAFVASSTIRRRPEVTYRWLRRLDPIHQSPLGLVIVSRHADVSTVIRHPALGSDERKADAAATKVNVLSKVLGRDHQTERRGPFLELFSNLMLFRDAPDHTRLRGLVSKAFTPRRAEAASARIQRIADQMLDEVESGQCMELMREFAYPLPARVICELMGVPPADHELIVRNARPLAVGFDPSPMRTPEAMTAADAATRSLLDYLEQLIAERRRAPGDDLLSGLIAAEDGGDRLDTDELLATVLLLLMAGHETTANLIGSGLLALLRHPGELERFRADPSLGPSAVDELLRYCSPVQMVERITLAEVKLGDVTIPPGRIVVAGLAAANRDPTVFRDPDRLDLSRAPNPHVAFGGGPHFCIGASLARVEARIALGTVIRRFPGLHAVEPPKWRGSFTIRGLREFHLAW